MTNTANTEVAKAQALCKNYWVKLRPLPLGQRELFNAEHSLKATLLFSVISGGNIKEPQRKELIDGLRKCGFIVMESGIGALAYIFTEKKGARPVGRPPKPKPEKSYMEPASNMSGRRPHPVETAERKVVATIEGVAIERGIPLPPKNWGKTAAVLKALEVGDSYETKSKKRNTLSGYERSVAKKLGIKVTARKVSDFTFRVWRVE